MTTDLEIKTFPSQDPRLDWVSIHDPRSLEYPIRRKIGTVEEKPRTWPLSRLRLNQRREGACTGFGNTADLMASPRPDPYATLEQAERFASRLYRYTLTIDEWAGEADEGTSVNASCNAVRHQNLIGGHRWCFSIEDVRDTVSVEAPVVIGIPWFEQMYDPRDSGLVEVGGPIVGGHCLTVFGYHPSMRITGEDWYARYRVFKVVNSWGLSYGKNGVCYLRYEDLRDLLKNWGEAAVHVDRRLVRLSQHPWAQAA